MFLFSKKTTFSSDSLLSIFPIGTMLILPYAISKNYLIASVFVLTLICYLGFVKQKGYTIEILAVILCLPALSELEVGVVIKNFNYLKVLLPYLIFSIFAFQFLHGKIEKRLISILKTPVLLMLSLTFIYSIWNGDFSLFRANPFTYIFNTICFFCIAYNDKLSFSSCRKTIDMLFFITGFFVVAQYFINYSPYDWIYSQQRVYNVEEIFRAKGLLGHSLCLSCVCLLYLCYILIQASSNNKIQWINLIFCCFIGLLTISRTTIYIGFIEMFLWLFLSKKYKSRNLIFLLLLIIPIFVFLTDYFFADVIAANFARLENASSDHRLAGYKTIFNLFSSHWFGVGANYFQVINNEFLFADGFIKDFGTIDNYFLTQIAKYGVFALIVYYFDYFFLLFVFKSSIYRKFLLSSFLLLFATRSLIGISFDLESFECFNIPFFMALAFLFRSVKE